MTTYSYILDLSEEEMKQLDRKLLSQIIDLIKRIASTTKNGDCLKECEKFSLALGLKMLKVCLIGSLLKCSFLSFKNVLRA